MYVSLLNEDFIAEDNMLQKKCIFVNLTAILSLLQIVNYRSWKEGL